MPSLGVPVTFGEISNVSILSEMVLMRENLVPDVSLGTHFFNELVEADILYFALFPDREGNTVHSAFLDRSPNRLPDLMPEESKWSNAIRVIDCPRPGTEGSLVLHANTLTQDVVCYRKARQP